MTDPKAPPSAYGKLGARKRRFRDALRGLSKLDAAPKLDVSAVSDQYVVDRYGTTRAELEASERAAEHPATGIEAEVDELLRERYAKINAERVEEPNEDDPQDIDPAEQEVL
jgi:hypothetical protein